MSKDLLTNICKWAGCFFVCSGAVCTSFQIHPANIYLLNAASVMYLIWGIRIKELNQIVVNLFLIGIYLIGILR